MKANLVLDLSVNDFEGFKKYIAEIPAFIAKHSGKYIVRGVQATTIEGDTRTPRHHRISGTREGTSIPERP